MRSLEACLAGGLLLSSVAAAGCGSDTDTTTGAGGAGGAGGSGGSGYETADHPAPPEVMTFGGPVLASPRVVAITYAGDANAGEVEGFVAELATSAYWKSIGAEYGVGPIQAGPHVHRPESAPSTLGDPALIDDLIANTTGASPPWGAADAGAIYVFVIPQGTVFYDSGAACCVDFDGYHFDAELGPVTVAYAIACACPGFDGPAVGDVDQLTSVISHELIEAATDPFPGTDAAFAQTDDDHAAWTVFTDGEVADMCEYEVEPYVHVPGVTRMVQRSWSNAEARAGREPCLPAREGPYFNSTPVLEDTVTVDYYGTSIDAEGVTIAVGETRTIAVKLWSEAETDGPWTVKAIDGSALLGGPKHLEMSWDKEQGKNGDTLNLTIHVLSEDKARGGEIFMIQSELGAASHLSVGVVGN